MSNKMNLLLVKQGCFGHLVNLTAYGFQFFLRTSEMFPWLTDRLITKVNRIDPCIIFTLILSYWFSAASVKLEQALLFNLGFQVHEVVAQIQLFEI